MSLVDLRHLFRGLRRTPVFTVVTLLTLALAIGTNTAVFSLVDQTLLRPLPYPQSGRLVAGSVLQLVLRQGLLLAAAGVLLGLIVTAALSRSFAALLYDVRPFDPVVFAGVAGLLLLVALAATALPAWRAARTQPMRVLREE